VKSIALIYCEENCQSNCLWGLTNHFTQNGWYKEASSRWMSAANDRLHICRTAKLMMYVPEEGRAWFGHHAAPALFILTACAQTQTLLCDGPCYNSKNAKQMGQEMKDMTDSSCARGTAIRIILHYPHYCTCAEYWC